MVTLKCPTFVGSKEQKNTLALKRPCFLLSQEYSSKANSINQNMLLKVRGEMYDGKKHPLDKNLTYFLVELTFIFYPLAI